MRRRRGWGSRLPRVTGPLTLSVIIPVFNEAETVVDALRAVLGVEIPGVELKVVVVESNSSDGSRRLVQDFEPDPRVKVILQDQALGKGNAVREGLRHVSGDLILIQDADLEYSVDDYPQLIAPIVSGATDFVLGCRHVPGQPIRVLHEAARTSKVLNVAHWIFTALFDIVYGVRLRDPFTMYKVFRADCLDGVRLTSDRFDFDWELAGKLIRLGHTPVEVPVQYVARSFARGKKIRVFRDPPTWIVACVRFRFARLRETPAHRTMAEGGEARPTAQMVSKTPQ